LENAADGTALVVLANKQTHKHTSKQANKQTNKQRNKTKEKTQNSKTNQQNCPFLSPNPEGKGFQAPPRGGGETSNPIPHTFLLRETGTPQCHLFEQRA